MGRKPCEHPDCCSCSVTNLISTYESKKHSSAELKLEAMKSLIVVKLSKASCIKVIKKKKKRKKREKEIQSLIETPSAACGAGDGDRRWVRVLLGCCAVRGAGCRAAMLGSSSAVCPAASPLPWCGSVQAEDMAEDMAGEGSGETL